MHKKSKFNIEKIDEKKLFESTIWVHFSKIKDLRVQDNQKYCFEHLYYLDCLRNDQWSK